MKEEKSQLKIGIALNYVNMILGNLIPIFYTPIMLSLLGQSEYGLYKLAGSVTSYLSLISMGLGSAITRYLIKAREEEGKTAEEHMLGLFSVIFNVIALAALAVGTALTMNLHLWYGASLTAAELDRMKILVFLMVINMALSFSQAPYLSVVTAHEQFLFYQGMNILSTCVAPILNLVALYAGFASVGMTMVSLAVSAVARILYQVYVRKSMCLKPRYRGMPTHMMKDILGFSFWIFVSNIVGQLYNSTDTVMIGLIPALATAGVAVYNVGGTFNGIMSSLTTGISSLLTPKANRLVFQGTSKEELTELATRVGRLQGYIMLLIVSGFIVFGKPFIYFYAGPAYGDSYWVAVAIMVPNMIPLLQSMCLSIITAQNRHRFRSIVYLGMAVLNVIGTWFMLKYMGVIGAALMSGIALVIGNGFIMNWYYHKHTGLNMLHFWREIGHSCKVPAALCVFWLLLTRVIDFYSIPAILVGVILYTLMYCAANWLFIMNEYEKQLIGELVQSAKRKIGRK